jgi:hypothetical protein
MEERKEESFDGKVKWFMANLYMQVREHQLIANLQLMATLRVMN